MIIAVCFAWLIALPSMSARMPSAQQTPSPTPTPIRNGSLPVVSPDGSQIAFISDRGGADDLFVINVDSSTERQLTHTPDDETNLAWTRDGKILFVVFKNDVGRLF